MARPFNARKMASYFKNDQGIMVYEADEHLFIGDRIALFQVDLDEAIATAYRPEEKHKHYRTAMGGGYEEHTYNDIPKFWERHIAMKDAYTIRPTNYFYQPKGNTLARKFTDGKQASWILKPLTDLLGPFAIDLDYHYQFEQLYDPRDSKNILPVRVSFRKELSGPLKIVALYATWMHKETQERGTDALYVEGY